ncbi:MAG: hypothetical protein H7147_06465, partial [Frankiaceae bacterium]|nr:hypothetical protein [Arenimonas sp.]
MRIISNRRENFEPSQGVGCRLSSEMAAMPERDGRIGDRLVAAGVLTIQQAELVARAQRGSQQRFGETAVALAFATQESVDAVLASQ